MIVTEQILHRANHGSLPETARLPLSAHPKTAAARAQWPGSARLTLVLLVTLTVAALGGCSLRHMAVDKISDAIAHSGTAFASDDDPELIQAAAPFSLKLMEGLLTEAPHHVGLLTAASGGFTQYAYAFVQQDADEAEARDLARARALRGRARVLYYRARDYGLRALDAKQPGFRAQFKLSVTQQSPT